MNVLLCCVGWCHCCVSSVASEHQFQKPQQVYDHRIIGLILLNMHGTIPVIVIHYVTTSPREFPMTFLWKHKSESAAVIHRIDATPWMSGLVAMRDASKLSGEVAQKMSQRHLTSSIIQSHPLTNMFFLHLRMV